MSVYSDTADHKFDVGDLDYNSSNKDLICVVCIYSNWDREAPPRGREIVLKLGSFENTSKHDAFSCSRKWDAPYPTSDT